MTSPTPTASSIYYAKPSITDLEVNFAADAARHGWGPRYNEYVEKFEREFAQFLASRYAIATSSCTGAIHLGLSTLGVGPGDEVICADINWIASIAPITYLGATPVFVDVLPDSWCIDPAAVEAAITPKTKAIIAVHLYGNLCDLDALEAIAKRHNIALIEDAAEALGSRWHGRAAGTTGLFGTFSFHGSKTLTTGEGGMLVCQDRDFFVKATAISNHGRKEGQARQFWPEMVGLKYKMSNMQAAVGCAQLQRVDELIAAKRRNFYRYKERLAGLPLQMNPEYEGTVNGFWMPTIVVNQDTAFDRTALMQCFKAQSIDARVFFWPLSMLPMFSHHVVNNPVSYRLHERAMNLPSYHDMTESDIDRVCAVIHDFFKSKS